MNRVIEAHDIKVKVKLLSSPTVIAQATVVIFDFWEEHAWKVLKSNKLHDKFQDYVWIQPPCFFSHGKWKELVFIDNLEVYNLVQMKVYNAYKYAKDKEESLTKDPAVIEDLSNIVIHDDEHPF